MVSCCGCRSGNSSLFFYWSMIWSENLNLLFGIMLLLTTATGNARTRVTITQGE
jgi:hypothetical protein